MVSTFFRKKFLFQILLISYLFSSCGGVYKPGDESLVKETTVKEIYVERLANLAIGTFGELPIAFSTKVNLPYLLYSMDRRCCFLHLIMQNCLPKTFLRTLIFMTQVSLYLLSVLELI